MTIYEGKTLTKQSFVIEDSVFVNCLLRDCDLFYSGGDSEWMNAAFENCRWHWRGPAAKTMQMVQMLGLLKQSQIPPSSPASSSKMN